MKGRPLVFACGTPVGGAVDSTLALARAALQAGHDVDLVLPAGDPYVTGGFPEAAIVKLSDRWPRLHEVAWAAYDAVFSKCDVERLGIEIRRATNFAGCVGRRVRQRSVMVVNSVRRLDLQRLLRTADRQESAVVWYLRESTALALLDEFGHEVDVLIANSKPLAAEASEMAARDCAYVPSVVDWGDLVEPADRRSILLVNAVESHGLQVALELARLMPERHFVLQESWPLGRAAEDDVRRKLAALPNVEFRSRTQRELVYRDARFLLVPHDPAVVANSRPRVALEAQHLGVPLLAHDIPGLASVAASPENLLAPGSAPQAWAQAINRLDEQYERHVEAARRFAAAEAPSAEAVWSMFVEACAPVLHRGDR